MENQTSGTTENMDDQTQTDPWAAAFAAIEQASTGDDKGSSDTGADDVPGGELENTDGDNQGEEVSSSPEDIDSNGDEVDTGGLDSSSRDSGTESVNAFDGMLGVTDESIKQYEEELNNNLHDQAINEVAQEFIKRGIRNRNGVLGATLDDPDICQRDEDGVPRFYNPETGREFTGDNPRRQAQEWVDDYNKELARVFNNTCNEYEQHLKNESAPSLAVMKFAPKYEKLDDIRRGMFDNVIEDYEITDDNGKVVGYSCDLDKALAMVDRQINMIQSYAKQHQQQDNKPTGPALDMKTSSGAVQAGNDTPPSSLAEAMERLQNAELEKLNKN